MVITTIMLHKQRKLVRTFERAGATSAARASTLDELGLQPDMAWHRLVAHGVLRCPAERRYFLDLANWQRLRHRRRTLALGFIAGLLVVLGLILIFNQTA